MYIVQSIIQVPGYKTEDLIGIYRNRSRLVDEQPGFVSFQLLQSETAPEEFVVQTTWQTKSDYIAWVKGTDFQRIHELERQYPDQELSDIKPTVKRYVVRAE